MQSPTDMEWIPDGTFRMGSNRFYPEERPVREVRVDGFWIDQTLVTVGQFSRFVHCTGYVTVAERPLDPAHFPGAEPDLLVPGSLVFRGTSGPVDLNDVLQWWAYAPGVTWRDSGPDDYPVTHVAYEDAAAYAAWAGKALPSEVEWEYAARGGLDSTIFPWGDNERPNGRCMANTWQGEFPWQNLLEDGFAGTSPVGTFPPNGYGLLDMIGNVWEWTRDRCDSRGAPPSRACCAVTEVTVEIPRHVIKGGSHLCAPNYCFRYRPAARQFEAIDTSAQHIGFRCVTRPT